MAPTWTVPGLLYFILYLIFDCFQVLLVLLGSIFDDMVVFEVFFNVSEQYFNASTYLEEELCLVSSKTNENFGNVRLKCIEDETIPQSNPAMVVKTEAAKRKVTQNVNTGSKVIILCIVLLQSLSEYTVTTKLTTICKLLPSRFTNTTETNFFTLEFFEWINRERLVD